MSYLFFFCISTLFAYSAQKYEHSRVLFLFFSALSIFTLVFLGGFRDLEIGVDTSAYPVQAYEIVKSYDFWDLLLISFIVEPFYLLLSYLSVHCFYDDVHSILCLTQFVIVINFYIAFVRLRSYSPLWLSVLLFCFLFFNQSLNMQRQLIAASFVFLGYSYLIKRKLTVFIFYFVIAFLFHKSAFFALILILGIYVRNVNINKWLIGGCIAILFLYSYLLDYMVSFAFLGKYEIYSVGGEYDGAFSNSEFILRIVFLFLLWFMTIKKRKDATFYNIFCLFICEFIVNLLQTKSAFIGRIGIYIYMLYLIYIPQYYLRKTDNGKLIVNRCLFIIFFVFFYWWFVYIHSNAGATYPYSSKILGL